MANLKIPLCDHLTIPLNDHLNYILFVWVSVQVENCSQWPPQNSSQRLSWTFLSETKLKIHLNDHLKIPWRDLVENSSHWLPQNSSQCPLQNSFQRPSWVQNKISFQWPLTTSKFLSVTNLKIPLSDHLKFLLETKLKIPFRDLVKNSSQWPHHKSSQGLSWKFHSVTKLIITPWVQN